MPTPPLTKPEIMAAFRAMRKHGDQSRAAESIDLTRSGIQARLKRGVERGYFKASEAYSTRARASVKMLRAAAERSGVKMPEADPIELRRARDALVAARAERDAALKRAMAAEDLRAGLLGLGELRVAEVLPPPKQKRQGKRSAIFHLSDIQYAESIDLKEMDGVNSYNLEIANRRLARAFDIVCDLLTEHWKGEPPEVLHLCLGGDMVSGGIHAELVRTDEMLRLPSAQAVAAQIGAGIRRVRERVGCRIIIYSVPGNHGRLSIKPETKGAVADNLDTLVAWFVEAMFKDDADVDVRYGQSIDCVFDVYGFPFLLTHGDRMGSRGGQGFLGPVATILRGHFKLHADYADRGVILYRILTGHFHTTCRLPLGYGNGSVAGWSDFARDLRARKEPAVQNLLIVHDSGIIDHREIAMGTSGEGSIYRGR